MDKLDYHLDKVEDIEFACLPFIKNGGIFIKTTSNYSLGTTLSINLKLLDEAPITFTGKVVWITPKREQNQMPEGVGVQFAEEHAQQTRKAIEALAPDAFALMRKTNSFLK